MYDQEQIKKHINYYVEKLQLPVIPCSGKILKLQG
ncbi:hypothetical protein J2S25_000350 [Mesobacillus stamsii]|uniref:Uncharacterized protein n=1 Tax=Mesobacillus stamsii TaxID=225347 RepID=A0ABU0FQR8_9BACI|nr:hypothetical protein [Mesobacillus stamsii]